MLDRTEVDAPEPEPEPTAPERRSGWRIDIPGLRYEDLRSVKWQLYLSLVALAIGLSMGILQAADRGDFALEDFFNTDIDFYEAVGLQSYYQGLTLHGVTLALVFTFTFTNAFLSLTTMRGFNRPLASRALLDGSLVLAWAGVALAAWSILANEATVLFTFYTPLEGNPAFYVGAVLLVVSTWLVLANMLLTLRQWRRDNPGERIPLLSFISIISYIMWTIASVGIAAEILVWVLPWSLGWRETIDPQFTRILFWFTGHPIVYFWLMPIYVSWYVFLPKQVGGKLYSDGLVRIVFLSFLILIPVGVHHQFTDPGIPFTSKTIQWLLTFCIFYPSMVTLFTVVAALESGGKARGGKGLLGWIPKLPWGDPAVSGQLLAGIGFMLGGISGLVNASYTVNLTVHNTAFIVGHFHLTVGTAVALSIMAICYWLVPYLTGKQLWGRRLAVAQTWMWIVGVAIFSRGQMAGGIEGMPRRTNISEAPYVERFTGGGILESWNWADGMTAVGGTIMFLSGLVFFVVILATVFNRRKVPGIQLMPVVETPVHGPRDSWRILDQIGVWAGIAIVLSIVVYGEVIAHYWPINNVVDGGFRLW